MKCKISKSANGRKTAAPVIDNQSNDEDISNLFSINLKTVLNSAYDLSNRSELLTTVSDSLSTADLNSASITPNVVSEASSHLKLGKSDGTPQCAQTTSSAPLLFFANLSVSYLQPFYGMGISPVVLETALCSQFPNLERIPLCLITIDLLPLHPHLVKSLSGVS